MATQAQNPREELAKIEAERLAAQAKAKQVEEEYERKASELKAKLREEDLADVREKCRLHGFTATDLRGYLKTKGGARKAAATKSPAAKAPAKKRAARKTSKK